MPTASSAVRVKVWDLPTRLFHWLLAVLVLALAVSGELGMLDLHMTLGPAALALVLFRLIWGVVGSDTARFSHFVRGPRGVLAYLAAARRGAAHGVGHNPLGAFSVIALLAMVSLQALSGLFTTDDIATDGPLAHLMATKTVSLLSSIHRIGFKALLALIGAHLAAVAFYRLIKRDDLITPMITGEKLVPALSAPPRLRSPWLALAALVLAAAAVWGTLAAYPPPPSAF